MFSVKPRFLLCALGGFCILLCQSAICQDPAYERSFPVSPSEASAAIRNISFATKGRLPTVEGFVEPADVPMSRYDKGYFECTFQLSAMAGGRTVVRAEAKVTAWYSDPDAGRSGYRVLVSNGRLESDALDRIAEALTANSTGTTRRTESPAPVPSSGEGAKKSAIILPARTTNWGARPPATISSPVESSAPLPSTSFASAGFANSANEKKIEELTTYIQNLEEIKRNQSHPNDLAAVKKPDTPVFAQPSESARVLMHADAQDEFQVLGVDGTWVHIQISGVSRGWIRDGQLEMPLALSAAESAPNRNSAGSDAAFRIAREETTSFRGNWEPLKGKPVRIEWVEPANSGISTSRKAKLMFARSVFLRTFTNLLSTQPPAEGIVVVFDSADGGQIAASSSSVKALADGALSDAAFWRECSFEPQESFLAPTKK